jgi:hypothetical protein
VSTLLLTNLLTKKVNMRELTQEEMALVSGGSDEGDAGPVNSENGHCLTTGEGGWVQFEGLGQ